MHSNRKTRKLLMVIASCILAIVSAGIFLTTGLAAGGAGSKAAVKALEKSNYYGNQSICIEKRLEKLTAAAGLPESIDDNICMLEEILSFTKEYTTNRLKGYDSSLNTAPFKERLRERLYSAMEAEGMDKARINIEALNNYLSQAAAIYEQTVENAFVLNFHTTARQWAKNCMIFIGALMLFALMCIIFIYKLTKMRRKTLSYIIRSMIAAVWLSGILPVLGILLRFYEKVPASPEYMQALSESYIQGIFCMQIASASIGIVVIILCVIASFLINMKKMDS